MTCVKCKRETVKLLRRQCDLMENIKDGLRRQCDLMDKINARMEAGENMDEEYHELLRNMEIEDSKYPLLQLRRLDLAKHHTTPINDYK